MGVLGIGGLGLEELGVFPYSVISRCSSRVGRRSRGFPGRVNLGVAVQGVGGAGGLPRSMGVTGYEPHNIAAH